MARKSVVTPVELPPIERYEAAITKPDKAWATSSPMSKVIIRPLQLQTVNVPIVGETELIVHAWSEKAKKMMLGKQTGQKLEKRPLKVPFDDYTDSLYWLTPKPEKPTEEDVANATFGFPAVGFKAAIVGACRMVEGLPMTLAKISFRVNGIGEEMLIPLEGSPRMREDMVRLETGVADIRFRAGFRMWKALIPVTWNTSILSLNQLVNLINYAGFCGVGDWRPSAPKSATGSFGCFRVDTEAVGDLAE